MFYLRITKRGVKFSKANWVTLSDTGLETKPYNTYNYTLYNLMYKVEFPWALCFTWSTPGIAN